MDSSRYQVPFKASLQSPPTTVLTPWDVRYGFPQPIRPSAQETTTAAVMARYLVALAGKPAAQANAAFVAAQMAAEVFDVRVLPQVPGEVAVTPGARWMRRALELMEQALSEYGRTPSGSDVAAVLNASIALQSTPFDAVDTVVAALDLVAAGSDDAFVASMLRSAVANLLAVAEEVGKSPGGVLDRWWMRTRDRLAFQPIAAYRDRYTERHGTPFYVDDNLIDANEVQQAYAAFLGIPREQMLAALIVHDAPWVPHPDEMAVGPAEVDTWAVELGAIGTALETAAVALAHDKAAEGYSAPLDDGSGPNWVIARFPAGGFHSIGVNGDLVQAYDQEPRPGLTAAVAQARQRPPVGFTLAAGGGRIPAVEIAVPTEYIVDAAVWALRRETADIRYGTPAFARLVSAVAYEAAGSDEIHVDVREGESEVWRPGGHGVQGFVANFALAPPTVYRYGTRNTQPRRR